MNIGLLDFGEIDPHSNAIKTIHNTIEQAVCAEKNGFTKYWLAEHYKIGIAWRNPELIISLIAASTDHIKTGAAGVLVLLNNPYRIAQDFKLLSNLFPSRVDLGFAKGTADTALYEEIIQQESTETFYEKIIRINRFLKDEMKQTLLTPVSSIVPDLWMLGTSRSSIDFAVAHQLNFSLSLFHNLHPPLPSPFIIKEFRDKFISKNGYEPYINIAVSVFCSNKKSRIREEKRTRKNVLLNCYGNARDCYDQLSELCDHYHVKEVMVLNLGKNYEEKQLLIENLMKR
ncbi:MAG TPA: LLM class flavin-dependent oxidoreductase [Bacteroidia bacterium]|nr:LLM class flavin-dependent oxidoreductase [Bacteroidia bacterium]